MKTKSSRVQPRTSWPWSSNQSHFPHLWSEMVFWSFVFVSPLLSFASDERRNKNKHLKCHKHKSTRHQQVQQPGIREVEARGCGGAAREWAMHLQVPTVKPVSITSTSMLYETACTYTHTRLPDLGRAWSSDSDSEAWEGRARGPVGGAHTRGRRKR